MRTGYGAPTDPKEFEQLPIARAGAAPPWRCRPELLQTTDPSAVSTAGDPKGSGVKKIEARARTPRHADGLAGDWIREKPSHGSKKLVINQWRHNEIAERRHERDSDTGCATNAVVRRVRLTRRNGEDPQATGSRFGCSSIKAPSTGRPGQTTVSASTNPRGQKTGRSTAMRAVITIR